MRAAVTGIAAVYHQLALRKLDGRLFYLKIAPRSLLIPDRVPLLLMHDEIEEVDGADVVFTDGEDALQFSAILPDTISGNRIADNVRTGKLAGASVALKFETSDTEEIDGDLIVTVKRARLTELSLVDQPALRGSRIELASAEAVARDRRISASTGFAWHASRVAAGW